MEDVVHTGCIALLCLQVLRPRGCLPALICVARAVVAAAALQTQRQLQRSLEIHQRYIHSLMEQEGLAHKIPEMSAAFSAGALVPPGSVVSEAMPVQPLPVGSAHQQQQQQQGSSAAPSLQRQRSEQLQRQHSLPQQQQQQQQAERAPAAQRNDPQETGYSQQQQQHGGQAAAGMDGLGGNLLSDHDLLLGFPELRDTVDEAGAMGLLDEPQGKRQRLLTPDIAQFDGGDGQQ